ncbi:MAG TPA: copper chaperone PCu(A)C [Mycobacterium sp.]|nr:copper chaperone PCu(A)C [Mycobacterium sp.]
MSRKQLFIALAAGLVAAGCTTADHDEAPMASAVAISDQWASSAETGMAAVFGVLTNTGHHDAVVVSGSADVAGRVEVHEVVPNATGSSVMRPKEGGLTIPADGSHDLVPGGDHLMLMDLKEPLTPGSDVTMTVVFSDGSTLPITAQVRDFVGADEEYQPSGAPHSHG